MKGILSFPRLQANSSRLGDVDPCDPQLCKKKKACSKEERLRCQQEVVPAATDTDCSSLASLAQPSRIEIILHPQILRDGARKVVPRLDAAAVWEHGGQGFLGEGRGKKEGRRGELSKGKISQKSPGLGLYEHKCNWMRDLEICWAPLSGSYICL